MNSSSLGSMGFTRSEKAFCNKLGMVETMKQPKTQGFSTLESSEQQDIFRLLRSTGTKFRFSRDHSEIVLLKISVTGLIPRLVKQLAIGGAELIDFFGDLSRR